MNRWGSSLLLTGLLTIPISGALGAAMLLLRGPLVFPLADSSDWVGIVSSSNFLLYQSLLIVAFVLPFAGFLALYEFLGRGARAKKSSLFGLVLLLWGTALALPSLGIVSFVASAVSQPGLADKGTIGTIVTDAVTGSGSLIGIAAAILYSIGALLFGVAIWQNASLSKIAAVLFGIHGLLLSFGFSIFPLLIFGWLSLALGGIFLSVDVRKHLRADNNSA